MSRAEEAINRLLSYYRGGWRPVSGDPFRSLVRIVLSQNTSYRNESMAFEKLEREIGVTPEKISCASSEEISGAIRPAGMHNLRGRTLKRLAEAVLERHGGDIGPVLALDYPDARRELMALPGVGQKTADVLLMFDAGKAVIPVDRHIARIAKRLEIVGPRAGYDEVRLALQEAASTDRYVDVHVLLIRFGREVCRARRPRCDECFLSDLCPYPEKNRP